MAFTKPDPDLDFFRGVYFGGRLNAEANIEGGLQPIKEEMGVKKELGKGTETKTKTKTRTRTETGNASAEGAE